MVARAGDRDGHAASYDNARRYVTSPPPTLGTRRARMENRTHGIGTADVATGSLQRAPRSLIVSAQPFSLHTKRRRRERRSCPTFVSIKSCSDVLRVIPIQTVALASTNGARQPGDLEQPSRRGELP